MFLFRKADQWASETSSREVYCAVKDLGGSNDCQAFMAYTLAKAVLDLKQRTGGTSLDTIAWQDIKSPKYAHPFGTTSLQRWF